MARSDSRPLPTLRDVAFTLQAGREAHEERLALVATSLQDLTKALERYFAGHAQSIIEGSLPSLGQWGFLPERTTRFIASSLLGGVWTTWHACGRKGLMFPGNSFTSGPDLPTFAAHLSLCARTPLAALWA